MQYSSTIDQHYKSSFTIRRAKSDSDLQGLALLDDVKESISDWAKDNIERRVDGATGVWRGADNNQTLWLVGDDDRAGRGFYAMIHERPVPDARDEARHTWWKLDLYLSTKDETVEVAIEDRCLDGSRQLTDDMDWPPPVVEQLIDKYDCWLGSEQIQAKAERLTHENGASFARESMLNPDRLFPIIAVSNGDVGGNAVDANRLQSRFLGIAKVVEYADDGAEWDVNNALGRQLACSGGDVRLYWPGCDADDDPDSHPRLDMKIARRLEQNLWLVLRDELIESQPSPIVNDRFNRARGQFNEISVAIRAIDLDKSQNTTSTDTTYAELFRLASDENTQLREENKLLQQDIDDFNEELRSRDYEIENLKKELAQTKHNLLDAQLHPQGESAPKETEEETQPAEVSEYSLVYYKRRNGPRSEPYRDWLNRLDKSDQDRIKKTVGQMQAGNLGDYRSVTGGFCERRIDFGPGYRIYFDIRGKSLLLLGGGDKSSQNRDIERMGRFLLMHNQQKIGQG